MAKYSKDQVTIVLLCHNEELALPEVLGAFQKAGFTSFLVMDDNSTDNTAKIARQFGAKVVRSTLPGMGFQAAMLKVLFSIDAANALIIPDPFVSIAPIAVQRFLELGVIGEYPLLLSQGKNRDGIDFSKILRKKYNLFLDQPSFQAVFVNRQMLAAIKKRVTGNGPYIFFELIKAALDEDLKIGVMHSGVAEKPYSLRGIWWWRRRKRLAMEKRRRKSYVKTAFPDLKRQQIQQKLILGITIAALGGSLATGLVALAIWLAHHAHHPLF